MFIFKEKQFRMSNFVLYILNILFPCVAYAGSFNKPLSYFLTDNIIFELLVIGGVYTLGTLGVCSVISIFIRKFRALFFSVGLACLGVYFVILIFDILDELSWLPPLHTI
jgi:uncharacterized membrane protein